MDQFGHGLYARYWGPTGPHVMVRGIDVMTGPPSRREKVAEATVHLHCHRGRYRWDGRRFDEIGELLSAVASEREEEQ